NRGVAAHFKFALEQTLQSFFVHKEENKIGCLRADLQAEASTCQIKVGGGAPPRVRATARDTATAATAKNESRLEHFWKDCHTKGFVKHRNRNGLVRRSHYLLEDRCGFYRLACRIVLVFCRSNSTGSSAEGEQETHDSG